MHHLCSQCEHTIQRCHHLMEHNDTCRYSDHTDTYNQNQEQHKKMLSMRYGKQQFLLLQFLDCLR